MSLLRGSWVDRGERFRRRAQRHALQRRVQPLQASDPGRLLRGDDGQGGGRERLSYGITEQRARSGHSWGISQGVLRGGGTWDWGEEC